MQRRGFLGTMGALFAAVVTAPQGRAHAPRLTSVSAGPFRGMLALPDHPTSAAVLLLPTIAAINPYMLRVASELAARGYASLVWDPYRGEVAPQTTADQLSRSKRIRDDDAMGELQAAVDYLTGPHKLRSVATIGWCLGGRFGLLHAGIDQRVAATIAYNPTIYAQQPVALYGIPTSKADFPGQSLDEFALAAKIDCPVQIFRPEHDLAQPAEYARLEQALLGRRAATQPAYFPAAKHGFSYHNDTPADRAAAKLAWPVTLAVLEATQA